MAPSLAGLESAFREIKRRSLLDSGCPVAVVGNSAWNTARAKASDFFPPGAHFETIYYPLDTDAFSPLDKVAAKRALGIDPGEFTVGFACTSLDNRRKGFDDLLRALALVESAGNPRLGLLSFGRIPPVVGKGLHPNAVAPARVRGWRRPEAHPILGHGLFCHSLSRRGIRANGQSRRWHAWHRGHRRPVSEGS